MSALIVLCLVACRSKNELPTDTEPEVRDSSVDDTGQPQDACPVLHVTTEVDLSGSPYSGAEAELVVTNLCVGEESLAVTGALSGSSDITADLTVPALAPGEAHTLTVVFTPSDFELQEATIAWASTGGEATTTITAQALADADGDGFDSIEAGGDDCDDSDPNVNPWAGETWYDGVDQDCLGDSDYDQDGDGWDSDEHNGGGDCDDTDYYVHPGAEDTWYDGIDSDCAGDSDYDQDGDGQDSADWGGEDCDDTDAAIYSGAAEAWYDGVDQDCAGDDDYDQDGDGDPSEEYGGTDCDDTDAAVFYDSGETAQDTADDDCDGLVDEDFISSGDVLPVEIMVDPSAVGDGKGEWFELMNTTAVDIDLVGWELRGNDGDVHVIAESLVVEAGGVVVLGVNADTSLNGDVELDYEYDRADFDMANDKDSVLLYLEGSQIAKSKWDADWTVTEGASLNLDVDHVSLANANDLTYWCDSTDSFGDGDLGTPGEANAQCTANDYDGDGYSRDEGDCDESDASVSPDAAETWDGVDNDCDDLVDDLDVEDVAAGYLEGGSSDQLGWGDGVLLGDWDDDGQLDLAGGGWYGGKSYYDGGLWLVDGAPYSGYAGQISDNDYARVTGGSYYNWLAQQDRSPSDVDGDGAHDLVVVGTDYYYDTYGNYAGGVFLSGSLSGSLDIGDADILFSDSPSYAHQEGLSSLDLDGDGGDEFIYADFQSTSYYFGEIYVFLSGSVASGNTYDLGDDNDLSWIAPDARDYLGHSLGGGDVDGDGYDDLLASSPGADQGTTNSGSVFLLYGAASVTSSTAVESDAAVIFYGESGSDALGHAARPQVGDFDGDGNGDVVLSAPQVDSVYIFYGASSLSGKVRVDTADVVLVGEDRDHFGLELGVGDVDADGVDDLVVGAPDDLYPGYATADQSGALHLFYGADLDSSMSGSSDASVSLYGPDADDLFGRSFALGDLDSDGHDDLVVSAPGAVSKRGRLWIVEGN